ncbi:helix-turn-helix domain-containing protein [Kribbella sp. HUAS MG21]|uniref:Helix-turn-helix domain-containing protein n=1 Tax=Kribbella sp. HUAS MG21 TaxID=3160966 RepID=A0AAU7TJY9_9ACTN
MTGLRARTRDAVRAQLAELAIGLFLDRGYDATTVDDIAAAAGVSKRSFFRYFGTKDDAVFHGADAVAERVARELETAEGDDWDCLRQVLTRWQDAIYASGRVLELVESSPALRARMVEKRDELRRLISAALLARPGSTLDAYSADLLTAAAGAVLDASAQEWLRTGGDRAELIKRGFEELGPRRR